MYQIKNIANDRFKGVLFRRDGHFGSSVAPLSLQLEPLVGDKLLKIGHQTTLTPEEFLACKDVIDTHVNGHVLEVTNLNPVSEAPVPPVVIEATPIDTPVEEVKPEVKLDTPVIVEEVKPTPIVEPKIETPIKKSGKGK